MMKRACMLWCMVWIMLIALVLLTGGSASAQNAGTSSFYQVTYENKEVRNLQQPPSTNKGILMVTKITTYEASDSYSTVSTGNQPMEVLNSPKTVRTQLKWDGRAWVEKITTPPPGPTPAAGGAADRKQLTELLKKIIAAGKAIEAAQAQLGKDDQADATETMRAKLQDALNAQRDALAAAALLAAKGAPNRNTDDLNKPKDPPATLTDVTSVSGGGGCWDPLNPAAGWPGFGNLTVVSQKPNPDYDVGPRVILRRQE